MLRELRVADFAIIDEALVEFGPGLNTLTGETGAGKSILVGALGLVLGGRSSEEMIRSSAQSATVEARFGTEDAPGLRQWLAEAGFGDGAELLIRRIVSRSGRNKVFINGAMATVAQVKEAGDRLVDIHGQNEHQTLLDPQTHLYVYDRFLGLDTQRSEYEKMYSLLSAARQRLNKAIGGQKETERRIDLLRHQVNEITAADLKPGEEETLAAEKARLANSEKLLELASGAATGLDEMENSARDLLHQAKGALDQMAAFDKSVEGLDQSLAGALFQIEEVIGDLRAYAEGIDRDPSRLENVEDRIDLIRNLKKKYGDTIEEVLGFLSKAGEELDGLTFDRENIDKLAEEVDRLGVETSTAALALDKKRVGGASSFSKAILEQLADLNMEKSVVEPRLSYEESADSPCVKDGKKIKLGPDGAGTLEFLFSANPGEPPKPLAKIASGGEISRLMLAIKSVISGGQTAPVMIFDEIDTGIGGATADMLGKKMRRLGETNQVFCITHLAQVAKYADVHFKVEKTEKDGRVSVAVRNINKTERVAELARMAAGSGEDSAHKTALKWAEEALDNVAVARPPRTG